MDVGIAPPGIINTIGSAACCAMLLGLDHAATLDAMAIGGGLAGWCPVGAVYHDGASVKPLLHGAWPSGIGVLAARYATGGMTGPRTLMRRLFSEIGPDRLAAAMAIRIAVRAYIMRAVVKTAQPTRPINARFHIDYGAALAGAGVDVILPEHSNRFDDYFTPAVVAAYCDLVMQIESEAEVDWLLAPFVGA